MDNRDATSPKHSLKALNIGLSRDSADTLMGAHFLRSVLS
jgi:hypothetical protein